MAVKFKSIAGKVSALALAISVLAVPLTAQAQEQGRRFRDNEAAGNVGGDNEARRAPRSAPREDNGQRWSRPAQSAAQAAPAVDYQQGRAAQAPGWNRSADHRGGSEWRGESARPAPAPQPQAAPAPIPPQRSWTDRQPDRARSWSRGDAQQGYRDAYRRADVTGWVDRKCDIGARYLRGNAHLGGVDRSRRSYAYKAPFRIRPRTSSPLSILVARAVKASWENCDGFRSSMGELGVFGAVVIVAARGDAHKAGQKKSGNEKFLFHGKILH